MVAFFAVLISTFVGGIVGIVMLTAFSPVNLIFMAIGFKFIWWWPIALALPTTVLVLPLVHIFVQNSILRTISLLFCGTLSGSITVFLMFGSIIPVKPHGTLYEMIFYAGGFAGFAAAAVFDSIAREAE
jgi:hypothetical protein